MTPQALFFDAGGTLIRLNPQVVAPALQQATGVAPAAEVMVAAHYRAMHEMSQRLLAGEEAPWAWWCQRFLRLVDVPITPAALEVLTTPGIWTQPIPGAAQAVARLQDEGMAVAVVSNADGSAATSLAQAGFRLDHVFDSHLLGVAKPDPAIFEAALAALGVAAERTWHVGDSLYHDVSGARAAGLAEAVLIDPLDLAPDAAPRLRSAADIGDILPPRD